MFKSPALKKAFKISPITLAILFVIAGAVLYVTEVPFLELMELKTVDLRYTARDTRIKASPVVLAVIDEKSIDLEGKWIWPRSKIAELVTKLSDAGAKVISFDIGFLEPDEKSVVRTIDAIQKNLSGIDEKNKALETIYNNPDVIALVKAGDIDGAIMKAREVADVHCQP